MENLGIDRRLYTDASGILLGGVIRAVLDGNETADLQMSSSNISCDISRKRRRSSSFRNPFVGKFRANNFESQGLDCDFFSIRLRVESIGEGGILAPENRGLLCFANANRFLIGNRFSITLDEANTELAVIDNVRKFKNGTYVHVYPNTDGESRTLELPMALCYPVHHTTLQKYIKKNCNYHQ
jgi:hypothetical protein